MNPPIISKGQLNAALSNFKDEEKQLSESLYRNLHVMMRFHEPIKEFRQIFEPHMFTKSNAKAFLFVMHFIFNCLDATEFKKRFRWPILDKKSESQFRVAAVDYMNHLNTTHQLGLEKLQLSNVHKPVGLKFIKIIHRFTFLIMKIELAKSKHGSLPDFNEIPDPNEQFSQLEKLFDEGLGYVTRLEAQSDILNNRIDEINALMESFFQNVDSLEPIKGRCWTCLAMGWRDELDIAIKNEVKPCLERVKEIGKQSGQLNEQLAELFVDRKENVCQYDIVKFSIAKDNLKKRNPNLQQVIDGVVRNNSINFENMLTIFTFTLPDIMKKIERFKFRNFEALEFEYDEVENLTKKVSTVEEKMIEEEVLLEIYQRMDVEGFRNFASSNPLANPTLPFSLMYTPQMTRQIDSSRTMNRLASMDGKFGPVKLFKEPLPPKNRGVKQRNLSNRRMSIGQPSSHQLNSINTSLNLISRRASNNTSVTECRTSTPMPPICNPVDRRRSNGPNSLFLSFPSTPTHATIFTTPENTVDRFIQSNRAMHIRSPTRRFEETGRNNNIPRNLLTTMQPVASTTEYRDTASVTLGVCNISMNGTICDSTDHNVL